MSEHAEELARLRRALDRERRARSQAESIAEATTARLYQAVTRLEEEHEAMREIASAATHDIKNPLASIIGFVTLLQSDRLTGDLRVDVMQRLVTATDYTRTLIDGLLEVLGASAHDADPVPIDLGPLLADVQADLHARHPDVAMHHRVDCWVLGHPTDTRRLFDNLAENAARHADADPVEITVDHVATDARGMVLRVGDNGSGVPPGDRDRIFQIFQRGSGRTPDSGSGVGLAVAQRIARTAHGDLWLDDRPAPGGGAAFMVRLPAAS